MDLDHRGEAFLRSARADTARLRILTVLAGITMSVMLLIGVAQFIALHNIARQTNQVLVTQIPALKQTIADQQNVLGQAIDAISMLCDQIKTLGGACPKILLKPPVH